MADSAGDIKLLGSINQLAISIGYDVISDPDGSEEELQAAIEESNG